MKSDILNRQTEKKEVNYVKKTIDQLSEGINERLGGNEESKEKLKTEIIKIINQGDFRNQAEEVLDLAEALPKNGDNQTEAVITAKEIKISLDKWQEEHIDEVRSYRKQIFEENFEKETKKLNPEINSEEIEAIKTKSSLIAEIYFGSGGIENQKDKVVEANKEMSVGKLKNSWMEVQALVGLMRKNSSEIEETVKKNDEVDTKLNGIKIPYETIPQARAYDDVIDNFRQPEVRQTFESIRSGIGMVNKISQITGGWMEKGVVKIANNFTSKIGNQAASDFVKNSVGILAKEGLNGGIKTILKGLASGGVKAVASGGVATGAGIAAGVAGGPPGWIIAAVTLVKKIIGKVADKLGVNFVGKMKEAIAVTGNKVIDGTIQGAEALVTIPTMATGTTTVTVGGVIVAVIAGLIIYQTLQSNIVSSLVPEVEIEKTGSGGGSSGGGGGSSNIEVDMNPVLIPSQTVQCRSEMTSYQNELMTKVNSAGYRTRAGVVAAAYYLAAEFPYKVPYFFSGGHSWRSDFDRDGGFVLESENSYITEWGCPKTEPSKGEEKPPTSNIPFGLDCSGFVDWAYLTAGFKNFEPNREYRYGEDGNYLRMYFEPKNCEYIKENIKPGDVLKKWEGGAHTGVIVQISGDKIKYAQSSPRGVNIEFIDICTGQKIDGSKNSFEAVDLMDGYFNKFGSN
ncbi:MAG TPA: hypothetical protein PKZ92_01895 [Candidatus Woesebacteria bacterium]|jgi:hypothetical protein|nr:hypothetical protein [Candidatus Shapirobacteria bacterium]HOR01989.1 hypothetical protein [Candidatus Woesebacteria bacterium]